MKQSCEAIYGECEQPDNFTVVQACPENYTRIDLTRCIKNCKQILEDYRITLNAKYGELN